MTDVIANHSPNMAWGFQVFEVVLKQWAYQRAFTVRVTGNLQGFDVMEAAVEVLAGTLRDEAGHDDALRLVLTDSAGDDLQIDDEGEDDVEFLKPLCVSIRLVAWEPPTLNEVRRMNGAPPVPEGDVPWEPDGARAPPPSPGARVPGTVVGGSPS